MATYLYCPSLSLQVYDDHLKGGVHLTHTINSDTDLNVGQVTSACLKFTTDLDSFSLGASIDYYDANIYTGGNYIRKGTFFVDTIEKRGDFYTVTAYDAVCKFDINIDSWLAGKTNISLKTLFHQLCSYDKINVGYVDNNFTNYDFTFKTLTNVTNLTGRALLQYIAGVAGGFVRVHTENDSDYGKVEIAYYSNNSIYTSSNPLTASDYNNLTIADYTAPQISAVRVEAKNGTCVRPNPNTNQELDLGYNPIFNLRTITDIGTYVSAIYNKLSAYPIYRPATFELYADPGIDCGDIVWLNYVKNGVGETSRVLIMTKEQVDNCVRYTCTGNSDRQPTITTNDDKINQSLLSNLLTETGYINQNYFNTTNTKVFNSNIQCNDIIMAGLGYPGNTSNTSLYNILQYLLAKSEGGGIDTHDVDIDLDNWGQGVQIINTNYTYAGHTVEVTGSVGYRKYGNNIQLYVVAPSAPPAGEDAKGPADGYANIKSNNNTIATYTCGCYTATGNINHDFHMDYPYGYTYEDIHYSVWLDNTPIVGTGVSGSPYDRDYTGDEFELELLEAEGYIRFTPKQAGIFEFKFQNPVDYVASTVYRIKIS